MDLMGVVENNRDNVVQNFCNMRDEASSNWNDKFFIDSEFFYTDANSLFKHLHDFSDYWKGVSNNVLQNLQQNIFRCLPIDAGRLRSDTEKPNVCGGFEYVGHPENEYVYDCNTLEIWHNDWNRKHTDIAEWEDEIFPFRSRIVDILKVELGKITENYANYKITEKKELFRVQNNGLKDEHDVVVCFYNLVIKHKSENERIAYVKEIAEKICEANGYYRERMLEKLEFDHGNDYAERIYCIKNKSGKYIFLSVDKKHGMLEWCGDDGEHLGELRFDGSSNTGAEPTSHSLKCVAEWKMLKQKC